MDVWRSAPSVAGTDNLRNEIVGYPLYGRPHTHIQAPVYPGNDPNVCPQSKIGPTSRVRLSS
jgi:hypothetical protein